MHFRNNFLLYIFTPLLILLVGSSYLRFMVLNDYVVAYEGTCDPYINTCFVGCEDDECTAEYYYSIVQKYAPDIHAQCGDDITDCEAANSCLSDNDRYCSITYCDPQTDDDSCEILEETNSEVLDDTLNEAFDTSDGGEGDAVSNTNI